MRSSWLGTVVLLLAVAVTAPGCGSGGNGGSGGEEGTPGAAVVTFFDLLNEGDLTGALDYYTEEAKVVVSDPEVFQGWADQVTQEGRIDSVSIVSSDVMDQTATVKFELVFEDGSREEHEVDCTNVNGAWKLGPIL